jgi:hypothetical protein
MAHTKLTSVLILLGSCVVNTAAQHDLHINRVRSKISGAHVILSKLNKFFLLINVYNSDLEDDILCLNQAR